jgi:hypothetical protein
MPSRPYPDFSIREYYRTAEAERNSGRWEWEWDIMIDYSENYSVTARISEYLIVAPLAKMTSDISQKVNDKIDGNSNFSG